MNRTTPQERRALEQLDRQSLACHQLARLERFIDAILPQNPFYAHKLASIPRPIVSLQDLAQLPLTCKEELAAEVGPGQLIPNLTYALSRYVRFHRTSGTHGRPLVVLDTDEDWQWWMEAWQYVLDAAEIGSDGRVLMSFSFGPFIGFWSAFDAVVERGALVIPTGGMDTRARLELLMESGVTALFATPSYALRMAQVAAEQGLDLAASEVRCLVVAGEPGGSVPAVRAQLESAYGARVIDHAGATEVGPWGFQDAQGQGLHVNEAEFIAEFLSPHTGHAAEQGELAELVLTNLGRVGCPVIRYRTGDLVRPVWDAGGPCRFVLLDGGVLGRVDDMLVIRGVNIFPSSIDQIVRSFPEVIEYRAVVRKQNAMDALLVEIEDRLQRPERVAQELRLRLGLNVEVTAVPAGSLPRFEGKGNRFRDER